MAAIDAPFHGQKTEFHLPATVGGTMDSATLVGEVADIGGLEQSRAIVDLLTYQDTFIRKLVGAKDPGTITVGLVWVPGDTDHETIRSNFDNVAKDVYAIKWVSGANFARADFEAYVANFNISQPVDDKVMLTVELAIDGDITFDLTGV